MLGYIMKSDTIYSYTLIFCGNKFGVFNNNKSESPKLTEVNYLNVTECS